MLTARSILQYYSHQRQKEQDYQSPASTRRIMAKGRRILQDVQKFNDMNNERYSIFFKAMMTGLFVGIIDTLICLALISLTGLRRVICLLR